MRGEVCERDARVPANGDRATVATLKGAARVAVMVAPSSTAAGITRAIVEVYAKTGGARARVARAGIMRADAPLLAADMFAADEIEVVLYNPGFGATPGGLVRIVVATWGEEPGPLPLVEVLRSTAIEVGEQQIATGAGHLVELRAVWDGDVAAYPAGGRYLWAWDGSSTAGALLHVGKVDPSTDLVWTPPDLFFAEGLFVGLSTSASVYANAAGESFARVSGVFRP